MDGRIGIAIEPIPEHDVIAEHDAIEPGILRDTRELDEAAQVLAVQPRVRLQTQRDPHPSDPRLF
jgi:hypothetical protein